MSDASVLINKSMRLISAKMKDSVFSIKLEHTFLQGIFNDLSEAQNKAMILEAKAVNKCEMQSKYQFNYY